MPNLELTGFRHPITNQVFMMPAEDAKAYLHFAKAFREQLKPQGILEEQLAQSLADAQWRLNHVRALENNIFAVQAASCGHTVNSPEPHSQPAVINATRSLQGHTAAVAFSTYEQRLNRQFHQNLKLLQQVQAERRQWETMELDQAARILEMEKEKALPGRPLAYSPSDDGFVFSISQIEAHIRLGNRHREARQLTAARAGAA